METSDCQVAPGQINYAAVCPKGPTCSMTLEGIFPSCVQSLRAIVERKITCNIHREAGIEQQLVVELLRPCTYCLPRGILTVATQTMHVLLKKKKKKKKNTKISPVICCFVNNNNFFELEKKNNFTHD